MLIYCIDISGSMDMVFEKKSRLDAVKEAITDELKRMKSEKNNTEIAIVTFGSNVSVYSQDSVVVPTNLYDNFEGVVNFAKGVKDFSFTLNKKFKDLKEYVDDLCTYGSTALGPGLLLSIELASRGRKGSKIILCTDG
jgi:Mg-chelatase subunit ChlD